MYDVYVLVSLDVVTLSSSNVDTRAMFDTTVVDEFVSV